jgi:hypothetical protein
VKQHEEFLPDTHIKILEDLCRQVRYRDATDPNLFHWEEKVYPNIRTSSAFSLGGRYFVQPGSAVYGSARIFNDTWGVDAWDAQLGISYEIPVASWKFAERGTANFNYDQLLFKYDDFRNVLEGGAAGSEPLYDMSADIFQLYVSFWF